VVEGIQRRPISIRYDPDAQTYTITVSGVAGARGSVSAALVFDEPVAGSVDVAVGMMPGLTRGSALNPDTIWWYGDATPSDAATISAESGTYIRLPMDSYRLTSGGGIEILGRGWPQDIPNQSPWYEVGPYLSVDTVGLCAYWYSGRMTLYYCGVSDDTSNYVYFGGPYGATVQQGHLQVGTAGLDWSYLVGIVTLSGGVPTMMLDYSARSDMETHGISTWVHSKTTDGGPLVMQFVRGHLVWTGTDTTTTTTGDESSHTTTSTTTTTTTTSTTTTTTTTTTGPDLLYCVWHQSWQIGSEFTVPIGDPVYIICMYMNAETAAGYPHYYRGIWADRSEYLYGPVPDCADCTSTTTTSTTTTTTTTTTTGPNEGWEWPRWLCMTWWYYDSDDCTGVPWYESTEHWYGYYDGHGDYDFVDYPRCYNYQGPGSRLEEYRYDGPCID
jgi:hypothetical protein